MMFLINLFTSLGMEETKPATYVPYKRHADCNRFDRFMNLVCYRLGLIRNLE